VSGPGQVPSAGQVDEADHNPRDLRGCFYSFLRFGGCFLYLYITMFLAILAAALISLLFFR
jgi:hypothetical protein